MSREDDAHRGCEFLLPYMLEGRYDELFEAGPAGKPRLKLTRLAKDAIADVTSWLLDNSWPESTLWPNSSIELERLTRYFTRQALMREIYAVRRRLFDPHQWHPASDHLVLDTILGDFASQPRVGSDEIELYAQIILCAVWTSISRYELFSTSYDTLEEISRELEALDRHVDAAEEAFTASRPQDPGDEPVAFILGVRALIDYQRGRICRAIGGPRMSAAKGLLTRALERYEERVTARARERSRERATSRGRRGATNKQHDFQGDDAAAAQSDLMFSSYRSASALLQLAYLNLLNSRCLTAEGQLKTAQLLARVASDEIQQFEIRMIALAARRLTLSAYDHRRPISKELPIIVRGLSECLEFSEAAQLRQYPNMARFQLALCDLYDYRTQRDLKDSEGMKHARAIDSTRRATVASPSPSKKAAVPPHDFWNVSKLLLEARIILHYARMVHDQRHRRADAARAIECVNKVLSSYEKRLEFTNLITDCRVYRAEAYLLQGKYTEAEDELAMVNDSFPSGGYTALPSATSLTALLRAEILVRRGSRRRASAWLAHFRRTRLRKTEVGWLRDRYTNLAAEFEESQVLPVISVEDLARDQELALRDDTNTDAQRARRYTYDQLIVSLTETLYRAAKQLNGGVVPSESELAARWGLTPYMVRKRLEEADLPRPSHGKSPE